MGKIEFENMSFCFTGGLAELKRDQAEREVRARNGFSQKNINRELNYLVLGSIASPGWKFGDFGNKILKAKQLKDTGAKLKIISEKDFMEGLEIYSPLDSGDIDKKLIICRYKSLFQNGDIDIDALEYFLKQLNETSKSHITSSIEEPYIYKELYNEFSEEDINNMLYFQCRIVKCYDLNEDYKSFIDEIKKGFDGIKGLDGEFYYTEKKEGSSSFAKLLQDIPIKVALGI